MILIRDAWDPLMWVLRFRQLALRFQGFRRSRGRMGPARFGYYHRRGTGDALPVVLVHGIALFPEWWAPLMKRMPTSYPLLVPELLGFSRSPGRELDPAAFTLKLYREQIEGLRAAMGWDRIILGGVSLGGWVCLDYALAHPNAVAGLVLLGPAGLTLDVGEKDLKKLRSVFYYETAEEFIGLINDYVLRRPRPIPRWVGEQAVRRSRRNGHKHLLNNLCFEDWVGRRASQIQSPTALIWGREDRVFPFSVGEAMEGIMPRARLIPMADTAHSYLFERPGATCRAFFDGLDFVENSTGR